MAMDNLPPYLKKAYEKINEYLNKNPEASIKEASIKTGINSGFYYKARKIITGGNPKRDNQMEMSKAEVGYYEIKKYMDENPGVSPSKAAKAIGTKYSYWYDFQKSPKFRELNKILIPVQTSKEKKPRIKHDFSEQSVVKTHKPIIALIGQPADIMSALKEVFQ